MSAWKTSTLGEVVSITGGGTPTRSNPDFYGGTIPWVTPKDMKSWEITGAQITLTQLGVDNSATRVVPRNSILIVVRSGVLKHTIPVGLNRVPVAINQDMKALQCRDGIDADYLARFIKARSPVILQWVRATTADNFPIDKLKKLPVPLPPLAEQRRIAEVLDRAEALRAKRLTALSQLDFLTECFFLDLFGDPATNPKAWPVVSLAEVCSIAGQYGSGVPAIEFSQSLPRYVRITDIDAEGNLSPHRMSPGGSSSEWSDLTLESGDVLFARSGATVGKTYKYSRADGDCVFAGYLIRFRTIPTKLLPEVLFHFTRSQAYQRWVVARQRVVAQPNINAKQYGTELCVPLPPIELQREFARRVAVFEALKTAQRTSLAELDTLFASLQHRAFKGEL